MTKKLANVLGAVCYSLMLATTLGSQPAAADTITIRADEWLPYNGATTRNPPGYMIEIADQIAKANGHSIDYRTMPWKDALESVRQGTFDCVVGALKSDAAGFAFPAMAWGKSQNVFFGLEDSKWSYSGIESLSKVKLAVIEDYSYSEEIDAYIKANSKDPARILVIKPIGRAVINAVSQVANKRVDVMIEDFNVARQAILKLDMSDRIVQVGTATEPNEIYVACTPADPRGKRYATMFSQGTEKLRKSGALATILKKYSVPDWQP